MTGAAVPARRRRSHHARTCRMPVGLRTERAKVSASRRHAPSSQAKTSSPRRRGPRRRCVLPAGTVIGPSQIAAAASCGYTKLPVLRPAPRCHSLHRRRAGAVDAKPKPGQIRNSNAPMLAAMVVEAGGDPWILPVARDSLNTRICPRSRRHCRSPPHLRRRIRRQIRPRRARTGPLRRPLPFHRSAYPARQASRFLRAPARRSKADQNAGIFPKFFGLPGNPISSAATFLLFAAPILAALAGNRENFPRFSSRVTSRDAKGKSGLTRFVPATCTFNGPKPCAPSAPRAPATSPHSPAPTALWCPDASDSADGNSLDAGTTVNILLP